MCYDEITLSAYSDGELSDQVNREIRNHAERCEKCRSVIDRYRELNMLLSTADEEHRSDFRESELNSWNHLQTRLRREKSAAGVPLWGRRITVPLPLAAGVLFAVGLLVAALILVQGRLLPDNGPAVIAQQTRIDEPKAYPGKDASLEELEKMVKFFSEQGATIEITIELPSSPQLELIGEPQLIRAADYRKGVSQ